MKKIIIFTIVLLGWSLMAQVKPRQLVKGKIIALQNIENVTVFNKTTQKGAVSNIDGEFSIYAKTNDTLVFASLVFQRKLVIMKDSDFEMVTFNIKLEEKLNELDEVVVSNNSLTGNLIKDTDNIKIYKVDTNLDHKTIAKKLFDDDSRSSPTIQGRNNFEPDKWGMDLIGVGKKIGRALGLIKKSKSKEDLNQNEPYNFKDYAMNNYTFDFFVNELKLPIEEIGVFLDFCAKDVETSDQFLNKNPLEKIDVFFEKKKEYDLSKK